VDVTIATSEQAGRPPVRIYLLHHAGGSRTVFRGWPRHFPAGWEVVRVEAPGRGQRAGAPLHRLDEFVDHVLDTIPDDGIPYAVFGHSMGALAAFALALAAHERTRPAPVWVGLSAHPGPRIAGHPELHLHRLSPDRLRTALDGLGGVPAGVLADDRVWEIVEPLIRSDLTMAETWWPPPRLLVPTPITAFCGSDDLVAPPTTAAGWAAYTQNFQGLRVFPGGHFYFKGAEAVVVESLVADVERALSLLIGARS
jgi:surfactin synthase thioesterase subunit